MKESIRAATSDTQQEEVGIKERIFNNVLDPFFDWLSIKRSELEEGFDPREFADAFIDPLAQELHELGVDPNLVSIAGATAVVVGGGIATVADSRGQLENKTRVVSLSLMGGGAAADLLDGILARKYSNRNVEVGQIVDVVCDRAQESGIDLLNSLRAYEQRDTIEALLAELAAVTNSLPSYFRAEAEAKQVQVPEFAAGSRLARMLLKLATTLGPKDIELRGKKIPLRTLLLGLNVGTNIYTAYNRYLALAAGETSVQITEEKARLAKQRADALRKFTIVSAIATAGLHLWRDTVEKKEYGKFSEANAVKDSFQISVGPFSFSPKFKC